LKTSKLEPEYTANKLPSVIFITYDGLLDPLGGSQILPYVFGIAKHPRHIHILSFEKPERLVSGAGQLREQLNCADISWTPLIFTQRFGVAGKIWDLLRMYFFGVRIAFVERRKIVHARGHAAAQVGLFLKRWLGAKLLFDFRGLWVDERVDKGGWNLDRFVHRLQFRYYKKIEQELLAQADQLIVLTHAVVPEVVRLGGISTNKITVIPCCADFDHFFLADVSKRSVIRSQFNLPYDATVLGYLGSVGGMYLSDQFFRLVEFAADVNPLIHVLALTPDVEKYNSDMRRCLPASLHGRVRVRAANRDQVAQWLPGMDVLVAFARPSYARLSMSPTKIAEAFAAGIPTICNQGVGDVAEVVHDLDAGWVLDADSDAALAEAANLLDTIAHKGGKALRESARVHLGLEVAAQRYRSVYLKLDEACSVTPQD
jgi:glycosyltransferase involved in cell wall biosynthesis